MHSTAINKRSLNMDNNVDGFEETLQSKRQQISNEKTDQPSRVLLLKNLARGVTEVDVESFVEPFTKNPKIYLHASGGRAFVEFPDENAASKALEYFKNHPIQMKGTSVQVSFSNHNNVTTLEEKSETFKVILASVTNLLYPVDLELIYYLFSKYGQIDKIVTFMKSSTIYQALIQFTNPENAQQAMSQLHNRNIYDGCNTLQIQPSRLTELVVKSNGQKSWDFRSGQFPPGYNGRSQAIGYTNPNVTYGSQVPQPNVGNGISMQLSSLDHFPKEIRDLNIESTNASHATVLICYNLPDGMNIQKLFNLFSLYGSVFRIKILREKVNTALIQFTDYIYASIAQHLLQGAQVLGNDIQIRFSKNSEVKMPSSEVSEGDEDLQRNKEFSTKDQRYGVDDLEKYTKSVCKPTQTLFIANIPNEVTSGDLSNLLTPYGETLKVQLKHPKENSPTQMAIISMKNEKAALAALINLHNTQLQSRSIKVAFSKMVI